MLLASNRMTWGWNPKYKQTTSVGGSLGTTHEAASVKAWPAYENAYLAAQFGLDAGKSKKELTSDKYALANTGPEMKNAASIVLAQQMAKDNKVEAEECLKREFKMWLAGMHEDNARPHYHKNDGTHGPIKKDLSGLPLKVDDATATCDWAPTWWGQAGITHLAGVREFLKAEKTREVEEDFELQMLAHYGPSNLEQAWKYFKHWVKGRPVHSQCRDYNYDPDEFEKQFAAGKIPNKLPNRAGPVQMYPEQNPRYDNGGDGAPLKPPGGDASTAMDSDAMDDGMGAIPAQQPEPPSTTAQQPEPTGFAAMAQAAMFGPVGNFTTGVAPDVDMDHDWVVNQKTQERADTRRGKRREEKDRVDATGRRRGEIRRGDMDARNEDVLLVRRLERALSQNRYVDLNAIEPDERKDAPGYRYDINQRKYAARARDAVRNQIGKELHALTRSGWLYDKITPPQKRAPSPVGSGDGLDDDTMEQKVDDTPWKPLTPADAGFFNPEPA
jgi:hypothetical protein